MPPVRLTDIQILGKPVAIGANSPLRQSISMTNSLRFTHAQNNFLVGVLCPQLCQPGAEPVSIPVGASGDGME